MDPVQAQYEAFPYPARDPAEEAGRLIQGSPSHPVEIDHFLFAGRRDWSTPFRVLVAGGGTGDALVMLAQTLHDLRCPAEITYLDLSRASRAIAEARIAARGLSGIRFLTADLAEAPGLGPFDYIDCCGVLHHLPEPDAGFAALAAALAPEGGMGLMVYAPHGRTGVYALQAAFGALFGADPPETRAELAETALTALPETNWLKRNPFVGDHVSGGRAGLYDLLLHSRDRAYTIDALLAALGRAGLAPAQGGRAARPLAAVLEPARYEPVAYLPDTPEIHDRVAALSPEEAAAVAEHLAGNVKSHVVYAVHAAAAAGRIAAPGPEAVPHLTGAAPRALAGEIARRGALRLTRDGLAHSLAIPKAAAPLVALADGRQSLGAIARAAGRDWLAFAADWAGVDRALTGFNLLHYSRQARR